MNMQGITGNIKFGAAGLRKEYNVYVYEMSYGGKVRKVSLTNVNIQVTSDSVNLGGRVESWERS